MSFETSHHDQSDQQENEDYGLMEVIIVHHNIIFIAKLECTANQPLKIARY